MQSRGSDVFVPLDGSERDAEAAALGALIAGALQGEVILMRVVRPALPPLFQHRSRSAEDLTAERELVGHMARAVREAECDLETIEATLRGVPAKRIVLVSSNATNRILEWLRDHQIALAVVPAVRSGGLRRLTAPDLGASIALSGLAPVVTVDCRYATGRDRRPLPRVRHLRRPRCEAHQERTHLR